jgi:hypothetical protein
MKFKLSSTAGPLALAAMLFAVTSAHAVDLRSWDQKISQPGKRFVVLSAFDGEAVLDKETQLVWQRTPTESQFTWVGAQSYCGALAVSSRHGWRLPSYVEYMSLMDANSTGVDKLPDGHPFQGSFTWSFWSSTYYPGESDFALFIQPPNLTYSGLLTTTSGPRAWCVRGPGGTE